MINPKELSTDELYYSNTDYFSVSEYKKFLNCEFAGTKPFGEPSEAMMVGSYVDRFIEGTLEQWLKENEKFLYASRGPHKGQLKQCFQKAQEICDHISKDETFMQFMSGEKQTVMTGEIGGVPWKIKMDSYSPGIAINDLKIMQTVTNRQGQYINFISQWGYDIQGACYQEIVYQNTGETLPVFICAATKEDPINTVIVNIPQHVLDAALYEVKLNAPHFWSIKKGLLAPTMCGHCSYCLQERKSTPIISMDDLV